MISTQSMPAGLRRIANARPALRVVMAVGFCCIAAPARAQDKPFLFSVATAADPAPRSVRFEYEVGAGERTLLGDTGIGHEQRVAVRADRGRWTLIGRIGLLEDRRAYRSAQSGEVLFSVLRSPASGLSLAVGGGVLHEGGGVNVLLARLAGGRESPGWRLHGNLLLQKPFADHRDAVDLITTAGWALKITAGLAFGFETLAEDLEAFWDPAEAEGGARILVGPSMHIAPGGRRWQLTTTAGPVFHPSTTDGSSDAFRDLPPTRGRVDYAIRVGLAYRIR